ncbi:MAG: RNA polymerase sigma factor [Bacteroides sp.]|nr:RNA polymerase sigma factor [Bacteroides sp.]MCM1388742.1 RNA polymerase sigma factor [Bacteroides sp.]
MLTKWDELKLIAQCVAGDDRHAFERLVVEYNDDLRRFILNLTLGDAALTDDLAQDTFLKAYLSIKSFKGLSRFKTWLFRIACNEYYAHIRHRKELRLEPSYVVQDDCELPHDGADAKMDLQAVLASLNEKECSVLLLFYMQDYPLKKIVEITGIPEGTVKSLLSRAKKKLETELKNDGYER